MVPPMGLRDLLALRSLQHDGVPLTLEAALAAEGSPFQRSLLSLLVLDGRSVSTYVVREGGPDGAAGFVQARQRPGRPEADLLYIAPFPCSERAVPVWERLLLSLSQWAVSNGIVRLYATIQADGPEEGCLRRAGFLRYASDSVYRMEPLPASFAPRFCPDLRPQMARDAWALQRLYAGITPLRVQQAEGLIHAGWSVPTAEWSGRSWTKSYVLEGRDGLEAYLGIRRGSKGHWFRLVMRPEASERRRELLAHALAVIAQWPPRPVYTCVRQYQNGQADDLASLGFVFAGERALTVRHLAQHIRPALEEIVYRLQGAVSANINTSIPDNGHAADGLVPIMGLPGIEAAASRPDVTDRVRA